MADCERIISCEFFNDRMATMPATAQLFKRSYCHNDHTNCARHMLMSFLSETIMNIGDDLAKKISEIVPILAPNEQEKVRRLISS